MVSTSRFFSRVHFSFGFFAASFLAACAHLPHNSVSERASGASLVLDGLTESKVEAPILLRLGADTKMVEKVIYAHRSRSTSFEDVQVRHQQDGALDFVSRAETIKVEDGGPFVQEITAQRISGQTSLHDFAMPDPGEKLMIRVDRAGHVLRAGDYPPNSIFYVAPISLPEEAVKPGDTWTMQATWVSLEESVPYQLDMASILKRVWTCGKQRCAEIEISGEVGLQRPVQQVMAFKSLWKGFILFNIDAGTVVWSRVDSEEQFMSGNVRRSVTSCLEANLTEPAELKTQRRADAAAACANLSSPGDIAPVPAVAR